MGYLMHHGVKGMKWGVRRYQNPDGSLTDEGIYRYRAQKAARTKKDVDYIFNKMSTKDKKFLDANESDKEFLTLDEGEWVVKRFLEKDKGIPVAWLDIMSTNRQGHLSVAIGVNPDYRGQGKAAKLVKKGIKWFDKNADRLNATYLGYGAFNDNIASNKVARKSGFTYEPDKSNDEWSAYGYHYKKPKDNWIK